MIYVVATLTVKPEMRAELIAGAKACIAETRKEAGNIAYDMHESVSDPTRMVFVEQWENAEALGPHGKSEHMLKSPAASKPTVACEPMVSVLTDVAKQLAPGRCLT